ncbi:uncharacterized protein A4U43_C07F34070 [Asparagus officinalis]|uniref:Syntaxin N-terminal domain-containing protein n=1 Tax=Asparagus officinalis TaxID=4686 RepID=A0A5P1EGV4_ASPOF|nr:uncharacterized protein A4U43_C07F34070 [Asparagus officinalis]
MAPRRLDRDDAQPQLKRRRAGGANLDKFFEDVESVKDELKAVELLHKSLHDANEGSKTLHNASAVSSLRSRMDSDVSLALRKAKLIKLRLESLDRANAANRSVPGCGPGSSTDRTRSSVVAGLRKKLRDQMENFQTLRKQVSSEYKDTIKRRYYTVTADLYAPIVARVTGEDPGEDVVDELIRTGEGERFLKRAIEEQGRGTVVAVVEEIKERHGAEGAGEEFVESCTQVFDGPWLVMDGRRRGSWTI